MQSIWSNNVTLDQINEFSQNTLVSHLDIKIEKLTDDGLEGTMPVDKRTVQPHGVLHGGASCVLAETLGSIASNVIAYEANQMAVGQSIYANHLRAAQKGQVRGKAQLIHRGRKSHVWHINIFDENQKLICHSNLTMAIIEKPN